MYNLHPLTRHFCITPSTFCTVLAIELLVAASTIAAVVMVAMLSKETLLFLAIVESVLFVDAAATAAGTDGRRETLTFSCGGGGT